MKCSHCGQEAFEHSVCHPCMKAWLARRKVAFESAIKKFGPLNAENLRAIQKEVKRIEALPEEKP